MCSMLLLAWKHSTNKMDDEGYYRDSASLALALEGSQCSIQEIERKSTAKVETNVGVLPSV